ncbi:hypothetical protein BVZ80_01639B, partial [Haemophilus influenzae]
MSLKIQRATLK